MKFVIQKGSTILMGCTFNAAKNLVVGTNSVINGNCRIDTRGGILVGNNVSISNEVAIVTADHEMDHPEWLGRRQKVVIEDYVWIGMRAILLPGINIGRGAVIASGAIVTKNLEPLSVAAGVPARVIRSRKPGFEYNPTYRRLFQ